MKTRLILAWVVVAVSVGLVSAAEPGKLDPANGSWKLVLDKVAGDAGVPLTVYLLVENGKVTDAVGTAMTFNRALHTVDASALKIEGGAAKGTLKVTLNPDKWVPKDKKPIDCQIEVEAAAGDGQVKGTHKGKYYAKEISGAITGTLAVGGKLKSGKIDLVLQNALMDGPPHLLDALVTFSYDDGAGRDGNIRWVKPDQFHWTGKLSAVDVKSEGAALTGTLKGKIDAKAGTVLGGDYVWTINAKVYGSFVAGTLTAETGDKKKTGYLFGEVANARYEPK